MSRIASVADIEAFEATPAQQRWRGHSTYDVIAKTATRVPGHPALKFQATAAVDEAPRTLTYAQLLAQIHQTANALHAAGVKTGAVTSILLPNVLDIHPAIWGAQALGISGPINPLLEAEGMRDIMRESEAQALVVLGPVDGSAIWEKALSIADDVPSLKVIFQVNENGLPAWQKSQTPGGIPICDFRSSCAAQDGAALIFDRHINIEDVAAYFHTGGTTGTPKLAMHSHANQVHMASMMADMFDYDEMTVALGGLPMFHVNSFFNAGFNMLACGGCAVFPTAAGFRDKGVVKNLWKLIEKYQVTYFATVPTIVSALLDIDIGDADVSAMEFIICGAAPIAPEVFRAFQEKTAINVIEAYGMTEGSLFSAGNPTHGQKRLGSIGIRVPYQPMKCVVLDDDNHYMRDCDIDEVGTIVFQGPNVFLGYKQADKNKDAFVNGDWLVSGDLARQDADGYFWMTGRSKDLIIRGGHNIDPKEIEDILSEHPAVALSAAVGQPDAYAGELPCAYVTLGAEYGGAAPSPEELKAYAKDRVSERAAAPVIVEILDEMPVTVVGKIFKPDLRSMAIERVLSQVIAPSAPGTVVNVDKDDKLGVLARVDLGPHAQNETIVEEAKKALDQFTIPYTFTPTQR